MPSDEVMSGVIVTSDIGLLQRGPLQLLNGHAVFHVFGRIPRPVAPWREPKRESPGGIILDSGPGKKALPKKEYSNGACASLKSHDL